MVFYKGALTYETLNALPYPEINQLIEFANKIIKAKNK
jgi:hypothetical protein